MRASIVLAVAATFVAAVPEEVSAQGGTGRGPCDSATGPSPACLGYNPYYVPPGSNQAVGYPTAPFGTPQYYEQARALRAKAIGQSRQGGGIYEGP
jgi:hypothetical protein